MTIWCTPAGSVKIISLTHRTDKPCVPGLFFHPNNASTSLEVSSQCQKAVPDNHILQSRIRSVVFIFHTLRQGDPHGTFNLYSTNHHQLLSVHLHNAWNGILTLVGGWVLIYTCRRRAAHKATLQATFTLVWTVCFVRGCERE